MARRIDEGERRRTRQTPDDAEVDLISDRELLSRFANHQDEAAFDTLFHRHGAMVLATARRVMGNAHDAEDVCQAAFLLLAKKAATNRWQPSIAPWLHRTAHLLALKARTAAARRTRREGRAAAESAANPLLDLLAVLDAEVLALPEPLRGPIVLCYLEGATRDEAAERLRCPLATLKHRLERGRERLQAALVRRGMGLSTVLLGTLLTRSSIACASDGLAHDTVQAAAALAARQPISISAPVRELVETGAGTMLHTKVQALFAVLLVGGLISFAGAIAGGAGDDNKPAPNPTKEA
jgi:RNA polymerase sigma factor (sigma-70 family)